MLTLADRWIQQRFAHAVAEFEAHIAAYRFDLATKALYDFTWYEFCDWYLELAKPTLNDPASSDAAKRGTRHTLITTLEQLLRALHPLMPFITEEIWQRVAPRAGIAAESIMRQPYPAAAPEAMQPAIEAEVRWVMDFILGVRRIRGELDIAPSLQLSPRLQGASAPELERYGRHLGAIRRLAGIADALPLAAGEAPPQAAAAPACVGVRLVIVPVVVLRAPGADVSGCDLLRHQTPGPTPGKSCG